MEEGARQGVRREGISLVILSVCEESQTKRHRIRGRAKTEILHFVQDDVVDGYLDRP